jgi:hypothetical protein
LINVFEVFLPQLLAYPNPSDPLNGEAAALMLRDPEKYKAKIREVDYIPDCGHAHILDTVVKFDSGAGAAYLQVPA